MLNRRLIKYSIGFTFFLLAMIFINVSSIDASYMYCNKQIEGSKYYDCGSSVYTYYEDTEHSSIIYSLNSNESIIYAGKKDNMEIFYASGFKFYNVSYDDRSSRNNNLWTVITSRGSVIYNGKFKDSFFLDDSHSGYKGNLHRDVYTIRQYINDGDLYRTIVIYNYPKSDIKIDNATYDNQPLNDGLNEVLDAKEGFKVDISSKYGIKNHQSSINGNKVNSYLRKNSLIIDKNILNEHLIKGEESIIKVAIYDSLGVEKVIEYRLMLLNNEVLIKFSTMTSIVESSSRRIVISASAGKGKTLDRDYCWYYWSTSPDHSLNYEDFLKNYAASSYKGSYSEDKGVILRNTSGTYYLYALAKDDDSWVVEKSEGFVLNHDGNKINYNVYDGIFITSLLIISIIPIAIYLYVRKKGY